MPRILIPGRNPHTRSYLHVNGHGSTREIAFETESDVEPVREHARYLRDYVEKSVTPLRLRNGKVRAVVPIDLWVRAQREKWGDKEWRKWMRDPENADLQVQR